MSDDAPKNGNGEDEGWTRADSGLLARYRIFLTAADTSALSCRRFTMRNSVARLTSCFNVLITELHLLRHAMHSGNRVSLPSLTSIWIWGRCYKPLPTSTLNLLQAKCSMMSKMHVLFWSHPFWHRPQKNVVMKKLYDLFWMPLTGRRLPLNRVFFFLTCY